MFTSTRPYTNPPLFFGNTREKKGMREKKGIDYSTFGAPMAGRSYQSTSYRYGFNGMEKVDEVTGSTGTSYTAEYWQYDARLGRRWNTDPVVKPSRSPYDAFSNCPILFIDPNGDDDYYDEKGRFLGSTATGTDMRIINRTSWNTIKDNAWQQFQTANPGTQLSRELWEVAKYKLDQTTLSSQSTVVQVQSAEDQKKITDKLVEQTVADGKESGALIILDLSDAKAPKLYIDDKIKVTRYKTHISFPEYWYKKTDPDVHYTDQSYNKIILGTIHTHPQEKGDDNHGPSTPTNCADPQYVDTKSSATGKINYYVFDNGLYVATPGGEAKDIDDDTNLVKDAMQTYSDERPAPEN